MEDAGHWPQFEKPAEFNQVVGEFLRSVAGRPVDDVLRAG
jgi:2-hydroxy-6-oxo-6-(2'-carboxyphenyl)-hexa-2,4-dienoate hydrolase